jgi:hypothetical protein
MKSKLILSAIALFIVGIAAPAMAGAADMEVSTWDSPSCEHTMSTNHFTLAPGESVAITLAQGSCDAREGVLFFGYKTTKTRSRQLTSRDKIRLTVVEPDTGLEMASDSGSLFMAGEAASCTVYAENMNKKKSVNLRLRASILW